MKNLTHIIALTLITLLGWSTSQAQVIGLREIATGDLTLNECGELDTIAIEVYNCCSANTLTSISIADTLPSQVVYRGIIPNSNVNNVNTGNSAVPVISLDSLTNGQRDTLYILVSAECGAKAAASSASCNYYASWVDNGLAYNQLEYGRNIYSAIRRPNLQLLQQGTVNFTSAAIGNSYCRTWKIQNSGIGSLLDTVNLKLNYQNGLNFTSLKINGTTVTPTVSGSEVTYTIDAGLRNVGVYTSDFITIEECFTVVSCLSNFSSSDINVSWGCNNSICDTKSRIAIVRLSSAIPHITPKHTYKKGCYGGYDTLTVEMVNTGGFKASNLQFDLATGYSTYVTDRNGVACFIDTSSFKYYTKNGTKTSTSPSTVNLSKFNKSFFPISNHPYRAYVDLPDLEAGDTLYIEALVYRACLDETSCGSYHSTAANYDISFSKECVTGANYSLPARIRANHEGKRGGGEIDGPTDLLGGDTATFKFCFSSTSSNSFSYDLSEGYLHIKYTMPTGLSWTGDLADLALTKGTSSMNPDSTRIDAANNILHIFYGYSSSAIARGSRREYCISPKFVLDCNAPGATGGTNTLLGQAFDNFKPGCATNCEIPYSCQVNYTYNAHCPAPCVRGGFNPKISFIKRLNLGSPDNDEDGLPDATGTLDLDEIEIERVVAKDTFMLTYAGTVVRGPQSPAAFTYGYGTTKFPNNGNLVNHYRSDVRIWDASTLTTFTVSNVSVAYTTSGGNRTFSLNFSPSGTATGYPSGYVFDDGDSITLMAQFIFNPNVARTLDLVNVVENFYYLSDYAFPTHDSAKYRCDRWNAKLKTTDAYFTVWSPEVDVVDGCSNYRARYRSYLSIGACCSNYSTSSFFKKEYRAFAITDSLRVHIPPGFEIDSAYLRFDHGAAAGSSQINYRYNITPTRVSGNTAVFYVGDQYTTGSGTVLPSRGGFVQYLFVDYTPTCSAPANAPLPRKYDIFLKGVNTWEGYNRQWLNYGTGNVKFVSPVLSITNQGSVVSDGARRVISWDVKLQNDAASAEAKAAWLSFAKIGSNITIDSVRDISADTLLASSNGIFKAGALAGGGSTNSRSFKAYAVFNSCTADSIKAYGGWDCNDYPTTLSSNLCNVDSTILIVNPVTAVLQIDTLTAAKAEVEMCDEVEFLMSISQRDLASSYDNMLDVTLPRGLNLIADSSYILYKGDNTKHWFNPTNLNARTKRFDVSGNVPVIGTNGLAEFANAPSNEYQLRVLLAIDCDFESGSKIEFNATGTAPCGAVLEPAKYIQTIKIIGAPAITYQVPELRLEGDTLWGCDDSLSINAVYHNFDTTSSSIGHKFRVTLPYGFSFVPGSTNFSRNAFTNSQPTISYAYGQQVLNWSSAGTTPALDSSVWSFDVTSGSSACGYQEIVADITEDFVATCVADGSICSSTSIVNSTTGNIFSAKADIAIIYNQIEVMQDSFTTSIPDSLVVNLSLRNNGLYEPGSIRIEVYQDNANDNVIGAGDTLLIDTIVSSINPLQGAALQYTLIAPNGVLSCDMIVRVVPECACTDTLISTPGCNIVRLPVAISTFDVRKDKNQNAKLEWVTHTEVNSEYFVVQRSLDSKNFTSIGTVKAAGNSNQKNTYNYLDNLSNINTSTVYYRLKAIDTDGHVFYSATKHLAIKRIEATLAPNPANESVTISCNEETATVRIVDASGAKVSEGQLTNGLLKVNIQMLRTGVYFVLIQKEGSIIAHKKLVVVH